MRLLTVALAAIIVWPSLSFAHGDSPSFETVANGYLIDIGYEPAVPAPGEDVPLVFFLYTATGARRYVRYDAVNVHIQNSGGKTVADEHIEHGTDTVPELAVRFPEEDTYAIDASYQLSDGQTVAASFSLTVKEGAIATQSRVLITVIAAVALFAVAAATIVSGLRRG